MVFRTEKEIPIAFRTAPETGSEGDPDGDKDGTSKGDPTGGLDKHPWT